MDDRIRAMDCAERPAAYWHYRCVIAKRLLKYGRLNHIGRQPGLVARRDEPRKGLNNAAILSEASGKSSGARTGPVSEAPDDPMRSFDSIPISAIAWLFDWSVIGQSR
jgi:hypothetical protein